MNEWPISTANTTPQHQNVEERINVAKSLKTNFPVYVDSFGENNFENIYAGWPERAFIIHNNEIKFISYHKVDDSDQWHQHAENWISNYVQQD